MYTKSYKSTAVVLASAIALTAATMPVPASARSAAYCHAHVRSMAHHSEFNPVFLLPLIAVGAGVGALVGASIAGASVGTGAAIGAGSGAGLGILHGAAFYDGNHYDDYAVAYEECRSQ